MILKEKSKEVISSFLKKLKFDSMSRSVMFERDENQLKKYAKFILVSLEQYDQSQYQKVQRSFRLLELI